MDKRPTKQQKSTLADVIKFCFTSPNVTDSNWEPANVVDALDRIASAIYELAEAVENSNSVGESK